MDAWRKEFISVLSLLFAAFVIGSVTDTLFPALFWMTLFLLICQFRQIRRFEKWICAGGKGQYPKTSGIWEEIFYHIYRIKKSDKRRKKKLRKLIEQFRQSTEALPDAAVVLRSNDEIDWANKTARQVLGLQQADKGQRIINFVRFPDFIRYLKSGNYSEPAIIPSPLNNRITLEVRIICYGSGLRLLLAQDVTQLKKMQTMRKDFVANVSHELRTPLTVLKGYLETLQDMDDDASPLLTNSFKEMLGQTERMQHLVDDLLLLTRLETQQKKTQCIDVPALLSQICKEGDTMENASRRIELTLETSAHLYGEEQDLRSAFTNLLGNALKYSPDDSVVKVRWYQNKEEIILDVEDFGEGIAVSEIPRITERFYRVENKRRNKIPGTGLGLAIVKHVLMRHDANLKITSELGKGSCFSCHFPVRRNCCN
ncbi:MAG: phosphate regulon sensor histidine kinase PhoR [Methylovulum sp.]|uniref:phosphate regulon sensor histidine kinase PhoR n=1 Tax=Methylovulum sp. TaxID=1916980 RepID=UPI0026327479|nr:phosphate regulon sensor histidine kinase PhoR [Methylovulum sp.]MDD2723057.1 phosphate regulon sensor histidine kinase PhoR [Methylovulum sp.]MDD5123754.1 phosphate regulon sensor histidine kinase PhoR [Methylovulum sp.]